MACPQPGCCATTPKYAPDLRFSLAMRDAATGISPRRTITVKVTGSKTGYTTTSRTSPGTKMTQ